MIPGNFEKYKIAKMGFWIFKLCKYDPYVYFGAVAISALAVFYNYKIGPYGFFTNNTNKPTFLTQHTNHQI